MEYKRTQLFGHWFRQTLEQKNIQHSEYCHFKDDGSFEFIFIESEQGKVISQVTEYGSWGLVGDIHFTMTEAELIDDKFIESDLTDENNYHAYRVIQLNSQLFEYQHIVTKESYLLKRTMSTTPVC